MNCSECENDKGGPVQTLTGIGAVLHIACSVATGNDIEITCKRFAAKKKTVDPAWTCEDCELYEAQQLGECALTGTPVDDDDVACVKIETKETADKPRIKAADCPERIGLQADILFDDCKRRGSKCTVHDGDACDEVQP